jgi:demethylspheroidene O-methyltransferase
LDQSVWRQTVLDRLLAWRDRLLMSAKFQRWAAVFLPTRWIATRRERALFDLCAGFVYTQTLLACVRLQIFEVLSNGPATPEVIGTRVGLSPQMAQRLLLAATSLNLVERRSAQRFGLGPLGAAILGNPGVAAMIEHHSMLYQDLVDPVALLQGRPGSRELNAYWAYAKADSPSALAEERVTAYSALMAASQTMVAEDVVAAWPFDRYRRVLDVGGGEGVFLSAVGLAAPRAELILFDLPAVARRGAQRLQAAGHGGRSQAVGGDFCVDALPEGADLITLVRVLHDHDDDLVLQLLRAVRRAIPPDGTLLIAEPMAGTAGAERIADAYFGFYLLAMGSGRARTPAELKALLILAGFTDIKQPRTRRPLRVRLLTARPA